MIKDIIDSVIAMTADLELYAPINVGPMPANNGISIAPASGAPQATNLDKGQAMLLNVVLNGKHSNQATVLEALDAIHVLLTQALEYPDNGIWQITDIKATSVPHYLGREPDDQWLYGSGLQIAYYARKQNGGNE